MEATEDSYFKRANGQEHSETLCRDDRGLALQAIYAASAEVQGKPSADGIATARIGKKADRRRRHLRSKCTEVYGEQQGKIRRGQTKAETQKECFL
jgi:hypothetical protein